MTSLDEQLGTFRTEIKTDQWSVSIGELFSLYERDKLKINPAFQRFFRWSDTQKTLLIESVLLGFPVPPLFFAQNEDGVLEVVDGVQRLSTLLQLRGVLRQQRADGSSELAPPLVMHGAQYLTALDGLVWDEQAQLRVETELAFDTLTEAQRSDIEFAKLNATIIQRSSSSQSKYDVFRRLNSYGEPLTQQEMRAALIASVSSDCLEWLSGLARDETAAELLSLSERQLERQYDVELVLRFFFLAEADDVRQSELRDFAQLLDAYGIDLAGEFPSARSKALGDAFREMIQMVASSVGAGFFRRYVPDEKAFRGAFLNTSFEALGTAIGYRLLHGLPIRTDLDQVAEEFWGRDELTNRFATGRSTEWRLSTYVPIGRELLEP